MTAPGYDTTFLRRVANTIILLAGACFIALLTILFNQYVQINRRAIEARLYPPTEDWTFRGWREEANGHYSAEIYFFKARPECVYLSDQIVSVTYTTPGGQVGETLVRFIDDGSPGNSRDDGWQRLDTRVEFLTSDLEPGAILRSNFLHQCHEGLPTVSGFQNVVVGVEMPWPPYVQAWLDNDAEGTPSDYR